jgi:hypothetical protein
MLADRMKSFSGSQTSGMCNRARKLRAERVHVVNFAAGELQATRDGVSSPAVADYVISPACRSSLDHFTRHER